MYNVTDITDDKADDLTDEPIFDTPEANELPAYDIETQWEQGVGEYSFNYGSMFHIISFQNASIISLDIHTSSTNKLNIQVWTLKGSYVDHTDNEGGWELVCVVFINSVLYTQQVVVPNRFLMKTSRGMALDTPPHSHPNSSHQ